MRVTGSSSPGSELTPAPGCAAGAYPDSKPGRGSLKVVVRVLWSTKYRTLSFVYFISQPGGSGGSWIILLARRGSPDRPFGQCPHNYSSVPGRRQDSWRGTGERLPTPREGSPAWAAPQPRHGQSFPLHLWDTRPQCRPGPWRTAPSQTLLPPRPPTPVCEGLPTAWCGCCGSRNTLAHCPVSSLGEKGEKALAGVLGTALPFPAHRKFVSSPIPPPWLIWKRRDKPHVPPVCPSCLSLAVPACGRCQGRGQRCQAAQGLCSATHPRGTHTAPPGTRSRIPPHGSTGAFASSLHGLASSAHVCEHTPCLCCTQAQNSSSTHPRHPCTHSLPPWHCVCPAPPPPPCAASFPHAQPCTKQAGTPCHLPVTLLASASPLLHLTPGLWAAAPK